MVGDVLCGRVGGGIWSFPPLPPIDQHYKDQSNFWSLFESNTCCWCSGSQSHCAVWRPKQSWRFTMAHGNLNYLGGKAAKSYWFEHEAKLMEGITLVVPSPKHHRLHSTGKRVAVLLRHRGSLLRRRTWCVGSFKLYGEILHPGYWFHRQKSRNKSTPQFRPRIWRTQGMIEEKEKRFCVGRRG